MGDLPGSPSVAPSPLFCTALWGGKGAVVGFARCPGSPGSVVNTAGGQKRRRTEVVSTPLYAASPVAAELAPFSPSSSFSLFLFPPLLCFPFCFRARGVAPGARVAECGTGPRSRRFIVLRAAPPGRREQMRGFGSSAPSGVPPPRPGGVHCRGGGGVILAGAIIPALMHQIPSELRS
jgi:hypothetical protein